MPLFDSERPTKLSTNRSRSLTGWPGSGRSPEAIKPEVLKSAICRCSLLVLLLALFALRPPDSAFFVLGRTFMRGSRAIRYAERLSELTSHLSELADLRDLVEEAE